MEYKEEKYTNDLIEKLVASQKITEEITKNEDYINWLEGFTNNHKNFADDDWLYHPEKISEYDLSNVYKLSNFFEAIDNYANKNYIYSMVSEFGTNYYVKHNKFGYEIGVIVGQGTMFYVRRERLTKKNSDSFIDYKLIMESKVTDRAKIIVEKLEELDNFLINIANENIPIEAIEETTKKRLQLLKKK